MEGLPVVSPSSSCRSTARHVVRRISGPLGISPGSQSPVTMTIQEKTALFHDVYIVLFVFFFVIPESIAKGSSGKSFEH